MQDQTIQMILCKFQQDQTVS